MTTCDENYELNVVTNLEIIFNYIPVLQKVHNSQIVFANNFTFFSFQNSVLQKPQVQLENKQKYLVVIPNRRSDSFSCRGKRSNHCWEKRRKSNFFYSVGIQICKCTQNAPERNVRRANMFQRRAALRCTFMEFSGFNGNCPELDHSEQTI